MIWWSFGNGRSGCTFLPFLLLFGSCFLFNNFNSNWLWPMLIVGLLWFVTQMMFSQRPEPYYEDKPKRDFEGEKPKRTVVVGDDGELREVDEDLYDDNRRV